MSFIADRVVMDGLTFDDVLLIPATLYKRTKNFPRSGFAYEVFCKLSITHHRRL